MYVPDVRRDYCFSMIDLEVVRDARGAAELR